MNTSTTETSLMPLEDRIKVLAETLLRLFEMSSCCTIDAPPCLQIIYLCYSENNIHKINAEKATMSLIVLEPFVTEIVHVRQEIREKDLSNMPKYILKEYTDRQIQDLIDENQITFKRCSAFSKTKNGKVGDKHQCHGTCKTGSVFCHWHYRKDVTSRVIAASSSSSSSKREHVDEVATDVVSVSKRGRLNN